MSATRISFDWAYRGFSTCILENEFLKVTIVPDVGAKVWLVDGGWRGIRCVNVEPWITYPARLDEAIAAGRAEELDPGQEFEASTRLIGFSTSEHVKGFDDDGRPMS